MESSIMRIISSGLAVALLAMSAMPVAFAAETAAAPMPSDKFTAMAETTATVTKIDQKTREVTLKKEDGEDFTFVAGPEVKNLAQVKVGDRVTVQYGESLAYEVKKGGKVASPTTVVAGKSADPGAKPGAAVARMTTATVLITAIDPKVPSVTFQGPAGNTRTIKVMKPEKLQGVKVGDTVEVTYTEALAVKLEEAPKK
jgi:Cu/Ag efflux protein CusF